MYGAIEAGGTKFVCAYGTGPKDIHVSEAIPTTSPKETIARVAEFFAGRKLKRAGIACLAPSKSRKAASRD